jgi:RNA polymerase sigma factor (sigma-70 family)
MPRSVLGIQTVSSLDSEPLYKRYRTPLFGIVCRRLDGRIRDAEDVVQETFIEFFKSRRPAEIRHPLAYLTRIALRMINRRNLVEDRQGITYDSERLDALIEGSPDVNPDTLADALSLEKQIQGAMSRLTEHQQSVLYHCKYLGETYEEASTATGISIHMVEKHLIDAVAALLREKWDR